ncbi:hypothetical protein HBB16_07090 [Pseudonocardia sp. MCCB 268]|nr:hypothetical protein [Pseudonocardia cytotoxica]
MWTPRRTKAGGRDPAGPAGPDPGDGAERRRHGADRGGRCGGRRSSSRTLFETVEGCGHRSRRRHRSQQAPLDFLGPEQYPGPAGEDGACWRRGTQASRDE